MSVHSTGLDCNQKEVIEEIRTRLGKGDVALSVIEEKLDQILEQTTKTNGRVGKLEDGHRDFKMELVKMSYTWKHVVRDLAAILMIVAGASGAIIKGVDIMAERQPIEIHETVQK